MDLMIAFGDAVETKRVGDQGVVEALGIRFGSPNELDLHGDYFSAETDYGPHKGDGMAATLNHRFPLSRRSSSKAEKAFLEELSKRPFKNPVKAVVKDMGILVRHVLDLKDEYERTVFELAEKGKLHWSSGTASHMVDRDDDGHIRTWHVVEWAYTPTPAEPRLPAILPAKTWAETAPDLEVELPEGDGASPEQPTTDEGGETRPNEEPLSHTIPQETRTMDGAPEVIHKADRNELTAEVMKSILGEWKAQAIDPVTQRVDKLETLSGQVTEMLKAIQDSRQLESAGYVTNLGGTADPTHKSFGDYCLAVKRKDTKRLTKVYGVLPDTNTKDLTLDEGEGAGWLVPNEYATELLRVAGLNNQVMQRVRVIPVTAPAGTWPALDQYVAPTAGAGNTAFAGGVAASMTAEGGELAETEPNFTMLEWRVHKIGGYTQASNEMIGDSPQTIDALLSGLFGVAVGAKMESYIIRGNGVGVPLGILNSSAVVLASPATNNLFSWPDVASMQSRFKSVGGSGVWMIHPSVWPDILQMEIGTAGASAWVANMQAAQGNGINGYPIIMSEHQPQANNSGDVILADLSAYLLFQRQALSIAYSEHVGFLTDTGTWRFTARADGKPWLKNVITLADPQGSFTVSPFVVHND